MKCKCIWSILVLLTALLFGLIQVENAQAQNGPRSSLTINYYNTDAALFGALKSGAISIMGHPLTSAQLAVLPGNVQVARVPRLDVYAFTMNVNETISFYPNVRNPLTDAKFRKAIHRLSDRDNYVTTICGGLAGELPVPIAAASSSWMNMSVVDYVEGRATTRYPYPYESLTFNPAAANAILDDAGFKDIDTPPDGIRNYPSGWPGRPGRPNLDPLRFYIRNDDTLKNAAGLALARELTLAGIPVASTTAPFATCYTAVMAQRNYHIYTDSWSVGRFPTYLYNWFHSSRWFPGGSNYHTPPYGLGGLPEQLTIDSLVEKVWFPPTYADAMEACLDSQYWITEKLCLLIPLWSTGSFYGFSSDLLGVTNMQAIGPVNPYTYLKAWDTTGAPLTVGFFPPPVEVNQIYSRWPTEFETMNPFTADFQSLSPYNIMCDQPWLAQDWSSPPATWSDGLVQKSKVTYWFRDDAVDGLGDKDAEWIDPVTGTVLADFTPQWLEGGGYEFNCWYHASEPASWQYPDYKDIHHIRIYPDEKKAEVYFNVKSFWSMYWPCSCPIYSPTWKLTPLSSLQTRVFSGPIVAGTSLPLPYRTIGAPVEIINITRSDGKRMVEASGANDNDYEIVLGRIKLYTAIPIGVTITVNYWARGNPSGYAPGGLLIGTTGVGQAWVGAGPFYVTAHTPGNGGSTTYAVNKQFFLETPHEGEIDFWWNWIWEEPITRPMKGYYRTDIMDVVKSIWALDSKGRPFPPSPHWIPGADLIAAAGKCKITDHDNTIVTGDVSKTFGIPP